MDNFVLYVVFFKFNHNKIGVVNGTAKKERPR